MTYIIRILPLIILVYSACTINQVGLFSLSHGVLGFQSCTGL